MAFKKYNFLTAYLDHDAKQNIFNINALLIMNFLFLTAC